MYGRPYSGDESTSFSTRMYNQVFQGPHLDHVRVYLRLVPLVPVIKSLFIMLNKQYQLFVKLSPALNKNLGLVILIYCISYLTHARSCDACVITLSACTLQLDMTSITWRNVYMKDRYQVKVRPFKSIKQAVSVTGSRLYFMVTLSLRQPNQFKHNGM